MCSQSETSYSVHTGFLHTTAFQQQNLIALVTWYIYRLKIDSLCDICLNGVGTSMYRKLLPPSSIFHLMTDEKLTRLLHLQTCCAEIKRVLEIILVYNNYSELQTLSFTHTRIIYIAHTHRHRGEKSSYPY